MHSPIVVVLFFLWVLFRAWKGFQKGLGFALLSLLGIAVAYAVTFFYGASVSNLVASFGFDHEYRLFIVYPILFISVNFLVQHLPIKIFPVLRKRTRLTVLGGASIGALSGIVSGLIAIWFVALVQASFPKTGSKEEQQYSDVPAVNTKLAEEPFIQIVASKFVAESAELGLKLAGKSEMEAELSANAIRHPGRVLGSMQKVMSSEEMRSIMLSPHTQGMMAINDSNSLGSSLEFQDLMALPEMQSVVSTLAVEGKTEDESQRFVAEQLTFVWRRLQYLKNDARMQEALNDEKVQSLLREKNYAALMVNAKFQRILALVLDRQQDMSEVDFAALAAEAGVAEQTIGSEEEHFSAQESNFDNPPKKYQPMEVYKWRDDSGAVRYSDWDQVPLRYRASAEKLLR